VANGVTNLPDKLVLALSAALYAELTYSLLQSLKSKEEQIENLRRLITHVTNKVKELGLSLQGNLLSFTHLGISRPLLINSYYVQTTP
jgi:hypothetical protein